MRSTTCLAGLLALSASIFGCRQSPPPPQKRAERSIAAPAPAAQTAPPADTAAIDQAITANIGDPGKFRDLLVTLQQAIHKHDADAVAALVSYPITINPYTPSALTIRTPKTFIAHYDQIITPDVAEVVEKQQYEDLFVNYKGAMLGNGEVWIAGICKDKTCSQTDIKIRTIQNILGKPKAPGAPSSPRSG